MNARESQYAAELAFLRKDKNHSKARWKPQLHEKVLLKTQLKPDNIAEVTDKFLRLFEGS